MAQNKGSWYLWSTPASSGINTQRATFTDGLPVWSIDSGDLDGDGSADLISSGSDGAIYYGPISDGVHDQTDASAHLPRDAVDGYPLVNFVGDLDRDGYDDFAAIAAIADTTALAAGTAWLFYGSGF